MIRSIKQLEKSLWYAMRRHRTAHRDPYDRFWRLAVAGLHGKILARASFLENESEWKGKEIDFLKDRIDLLVNKIVDMEMELKK